MSDRVTFFRSWACISLWMASIVPSGRALAEAMTSEVGVAQVPGVELGPGTGVFTRQLVAPAVPQERIGLVESASSFACMLRFQFPLALLLETAATRLRRCNLFDGKKVGAVISGLPLLSMPAWVLAILSGAFRILRPKSAFYQFTYGWRCPIPRHVLDQLDLEATCIGRVFASLPPSRGLSDDQVPARQDRRPPYAASQQCASFVIPLFSTFPQHYESNI
jgi:phospholipid N-methyltransferase